MPMLSRFKAFRFNPARFKTPNAALPPKQEFTILFAVMLVIASGNTALISLMPVISRKLDLPDVALAIAFSCSSLIWTTSAPYWSRQIHQRGSRKLILSGLIGYVCSQLLCALTLGLGLLGLIPPIYAFAGFVASRAIYGFMGAAAPPAAQARIALHTMPAERTNAMAMLASAFGLGTIIGPALAPFFILPFIDNAGSAVIFGLFGVMTLIAVMAKLPDNDPIDYDLQPVSESYPGLGSEPTDASIVIATAPPSTVKLRWRDPRIKPWLLAGLIGGHAQAISGMTIGFLVLDRLKLPPDQAQSLIGLVLMIGAGASLLSQWALIPKLGLLPRQMVLFGSLISAIGLLLTAQATNLHALSVCYALSMLGFGFFRPGFTAGASLAVGRHEQGDVAGKVTAVNGAGYIIGPAFGMILYGLSPALPFELASAAMGGAILVTLLHVRMTSHKA